MIGVERQRGWLVVAREPASQEPVGCAYPRSLRNAFDVWIAPDRSYRLRAKAFTGAWILRGQDGTLARFTPGKDRTISVAETIVPDPQLALVVLLAHEAIRFDETIPHVTSATGGG
jgi:hypothetical protein